MQRWCSSTVGADPTQVQPCLDAMEIDQILIVDDQPSAVTFNNWIMQLKQQAEARKILYSLVRPKNDRGAHSAWPEPSAV